VFLFAGAAQLQAQALSEQGAMDDVVTVVLPSERPIDAGWDIVDALPMTCLQIWEAYGESDDDVIEIVTTMAGMSVINREIEFPQTEAAGAELGNGILKACASDRNDLMYAVIDRNVRRIAMEHADH
jgi:hypothetical protein